jgi:hypothetical protein
MTKFYLSRVATSILIDTKWKMFSLSFQEWEVKHARSIMCKWFDNCVLFTVKWQRLLFLNPSLGPTLSTHVMWLWMSPSKLDVRWAGIGRSLRMLCLMPRCSRGIMPCSGMRTVRWVSFSEFHKALFNVQLFRISIWDFSISMSKHWNQQLNSFVHSPKCTKKSQVGNFQTVLSCA